MPNRRRITRDGRCLHRLFIVLVPLLVFLAVNAPPAQSQSCYVSCGTATGGGMTCMVRAHVCIAYACPTLVHRSTVATGTVNANCNVGASGDLMATASHTPGQGPAANCTFLFMDGCYVSVVYPYTGCWGGGQQQTVPCVVTVADGLPVELMDFSVEDSSQENAGGRAVEEDNGKRRAPARTSSPSPV